MSQDRIQTYKDNMAGILAKHLLVKKVEERTPLLALKESLRSFFQEVMNLLQISDPLELLPLCTVRTDLKCIVNLEVMNILGEYSRDSEDFYRYLCDYDEIIDKLNTENPKFIMLHTDSPPYQGETLLFLGDQHAEDDLRGLISSLLAHDRGAEGKLLPGYPISMEDFNIWWAKSTRVTILKNVKEQTEELMLQLEG